MSTAAFIANLTTLTERLNEVLVTENEALREGITGQLNIFREEKERLTDLIEQQMAALKLNPALLQGAAPQHQAHFRVTAEKFRGLSTDHHRILRAAKTVTDRLLKTIAEQAEHSKGQVPGYDRSAAFRPSVIASKQAPAAIALDRLI